MPHYTDEGIVLLIALAKSRTAVAAAAASSDAMDTSSTRGSADNTYVRDRTCTKVRPPVDCQPTISASFDVHVNAPSPTFDALYHHQGKHNVDVCALKEYMQAPVPRTKLAMRLEKSESVSRASRRLALYRGALQTKRDEAATHHREKDARITEYIKDATLQLVKQEREQQLASLNATRQTALLRCERMLTVVTNELHHTFHVAKLIGDGTGWSFITDGIEQVTIQAMHQWDLVRDKCCASPNASQWHVRDFGVFIASFGILLHAIKELAVAQFGDDSSESASRAADVPQAITSMLMTTLNGIGLFTPLAFQDENEFNESILDGAIGRATPQVLTSTVHGSGAVLPVANMIQQFLLSLNHS